MEHAFDKDPALKRDFEKFHKELHKELFGTAEKAEDMKPIEVAMEADAIAIKPPRNPCPEYYNCVNICRLRYDSAYPSAACVTQYNSPFLGSATCRIARK
jgi:hypothetical protein